MYSDEKKEPTEANSNQDTAAQEANQDQSGAESSEQSSDYSSGKFHYLININDISDNTCKNILKEI